MTGGKCGAVYSEYAVGGKHGAAIYIEYGCGKVWSCTYIVSMVGGMGGAIGI